MKKTEQPAEIAATQFKSKCLELMKEVHDRKRESIVITKHGRPYVRVVPVDEQAGTFHGCMKGLVEVSGDLTEPAGVAWEVPRDEA